MLTNEEFEQLHTEPEENTKAVPIEEMPPENAETESTAFGTELFALLDAILGVDADG